MSRDKTKWQMCFILNTFQLLILFETIAQSRGEFIHSKNYKTNNVLTYLKFY